MSEIPKEKTFREAQVSRIQSVSMSPPGIRTYWIHTGFNPDSEGGPPKDVWRSIYPVLAIRSVVQNVYTKRVSRESYPEWDAPLEHQELMEANWQFESHTSEEQFIVHDPEYGLINTNDELMQEKNSESSICLCPWDYDQERDDDAISGVVATLTKTILKRSETLKRKTPSAQITS